MSKSISYDRIDENCIVDDVFEEEETDQNLAPLDDDFCFPNRHDDNKFESQFQHVIFDETYFENGIKNKNEENLNLNTNTNSASDLLGAGSSNFHNENININSNGGRCLDEKQQQNTESDANLDEMLFSVELENEEIIDVENNPKNHDNENESKKHIVMLNNKNISLSSELENTIRLVFIEMDERFQNLVQNFSSKEDKKLFEFSTKRTLQRQYCFNNETSYAKYKFKHEYLTKKSKEASTEPNENNINSKNNISSFSSSSILDSKYETFTINHNVKNEAEFQRIFNHHSKIQETDKNTLGYVGNYLKKGNRYLAMTRAIGDSQFKPEVIADPFIRKLSSSTIFKYDKIIMASDGIWDVLSSKDIQTNLNDVSFEQAKKSKTASLLCDCRNDQYQQHDNITLIILYFNWNFFK